MMTYMTMGSIALGMALVAALVIHVGILGTGLVALVTTEQRAISRKTALARTFYAAETALQWGVYQVVHQTGAADFANGGDPFNGDPPNGLSACGGGTAIEQDAPVQFADDVPAVGGTVDLFLFDAVGICNEGTPVETRRRLEVRFRK